MTNKKDIGGLFFKVLKNYSDTYSIYGNDFRLPLIRYGNINL